MSYIDLTEGNLRQLEIQSHGDVIDIRQRGKGPLIITTHDATARAVTNAVIEDNDLTKLRLWLNEGVQEDGIA